ncbi:hypothetical protein ANCDUO_20866, partial [Ancylostoma duodenale]
IRPNCRELVRFFHDNTVRVDGLGDVCSFALMDVGRHGDGKWNGSAAKPSAAPALDGKTELSVLHFATTNPEWKPPRASEQFLQRFRARLERDVSSAVHPGCLGDERNLQTNLLPMRGFLNCDALTEGTSECTESNNKLRSSPRHPG